MTTPFNDNEPRTTDAYADDPARTADVDASRTADVDADRAYEDDPARTADVDADRAFADEPARSDVAAGTADRGEVDPTYTDEPDRSAYANSDRLDDTGDALDRPIAEPVDDEQRSTDNAPEVSPDDPLVPDDIAVDFKARWDVIQQGFVDDPRNAVTDADKLVGDVLERLSSTFDQQHQSLEGQWSNGEPSTEDLRGALQRYRAFFDRLLTL